MRKLFALLLSVLILLSCFSGTALAQEISGQGENTAEEVYYTQEDFPDLWGAFYQYCDYDHDGRLSLTEVGDIKVFIFYFSNINLRGIEKLYNLKDIGFDDCDLSEMSGISQLSNLKSLTLINCRLTTLPDLTGLSNLTEIDLDGNKLSYAEISSKLPSRFEGQFLAIARAQNPDPVEQSVTSSGGAALNGTMLPDVVLDAALNNGAWDVRVSRLEETYAPEGAVLLLPVPSGEVTGVFYGETAVEYSLADGMVTVPFKGDGVYRVVAEEVTTTEPIEETTTEESTTEPVTEETTVTEPTTTEPATDETTTAGTGAESTTVQESTTNPYGAPDTGDGSIPVRLSIAGLLMGAVCVAAARKKES